MTSDAFLKALVREIVATEIAPALREEMKALRAANERGAEAPEYLTVAEAARIAKVDDETLRDWIRAGSLPAGRLPGDRQYRVRVADLHRVLAPGEKGAEVVPVEPSAEADRILSVVGARRASRGGR